MVFLFLRSSESTGLVDRDTGTVLVGKKKTSLPPGTAIRPGDTIVIRGDEFIVTDFAPPDMEQLSERSFQSIKTHDASYMISMSGIRSGSKVLESGVGNGVFSAHLLWAVTPGGMLTGVDISEQALGSCEFNLRKFFDLSNWKSAVGDIKTYSDDEIYDAAFLDIPDPWDAVSAVRELLRPGGSLVVYSPNFNQIEKAVTEMERNGFQVIETVELLKRNLLVREGKTRPDHRMLGHTAFISFGIRKSGFSQNTG